MWEQFISVLLTVLSGVLVYVISQWYTEFIARPIQEYKRLKAKVAQLLILYAPYYSNPWVYGAEGDFSAWKEASANIRELAAEVAAFAEIKPHQLFVFYAMPTKKDLIDASDNLIGLSNSFFTAAIREDRSVDLGIEYLREIKEKLQISRTRKK